MAVVLKEKRLIGVPKPEGEAYDIIKKVFNPYEIKLKDGEAIFIPHNRDSLKLLNNLNINTEGCDLFYHYYQLPQCIDGKKKLWLHQKETARFLFNNPYSFCLSTSRTGKTLSAATAADAAIEECGGSVLIVAPLTVANKGEWQKTYDNWFPHRSVQFVHKDRENELEKFAHVYIINPDGMKIVHDQLVQMTMDGKITAIIFDECTAFGDARSQQSVAARNIAKFAKFKWGLTATPGHPDKIYGQVKLINPDNMKMSLNAWRERTCERVMRKGFPKWVPMEGGEVAIREGMTPSIRFDKKDVLDHIPIPEVIDVKVPLSEQQKEWTKILGEELFIMADDKAVSALAKTALVQKLLQVSGGAVRSEDGEPVEVDATPKLEKLYELLRSTPRKKVVFSCFTAINDMLVRKIREQGLTCEKIDGSVTGSKRSDILNGFMENDDVHVLVCHPRTTAYGVELAAADAIICYGAPVTGSIMYSQLAERLSSAAQEAEKTYIYHLCAGSQDSLSFGALKKNVTSESEIVNLFTSHIKDFMN